MDFSGRGFVGTWSPEGLIARSEEALARGVAKAAHYAVAGLKKDLSVPGPTKTHKAGTSVGGVLIQASKPGEPPRKRLGLLRGSVRAEKADAKGTKWRVGTHWRYGFHLEFGTKRNLAPRPWLRPGMRSRRAAMTKIIRETLEDRSAGPAPAQGRGDGD